MSVVQLSGKVILKKMGSGSKSEHPAVYLETGDASYLLRRMGGNAFQDESLQKLEGKNITAKGVINQYIFLAKDIKEDKE